MARKAINRQVPPEHLQKIDPTIEAKWVWWISPLDNRMYKHNGTDQLLYVKRFGRRYYYTHPVPSIQTNSIVPISIRINAGSFGVEIQVQSFNVCLSNNSLSDFEDNFAWTPLSDGLDTAIDNPTILLDRYLLPSDKCLTLVNGIVQGTACIVSNGSFNLDSSFGPTGTSAVVLAPFTNYETKLYAKGNNWVTGSKADQSAYRSELVGIIAALNILISLSAITI